MKLGRLINKKLSLSKKNENPKEYVAEKDKILNQIGTLIQSNDLFFNTILSKNDLNVLKRRSVLLALRDTRKVYRKLSDIVNILHTTERVQRDSSSDDLENITADVQKKIIEFFKIYKLSKDTLSKFISTVSPPLEFLNVPLKEIKKIISLIKKYNENKIDMQTFHLQTLSKLNNIFKNIKITDGIDILENNCYTKLNTSRLKFNIRQFYFQYSVTKYFESLPVRPMLQRDIKKIIQLSANDDNIKEFISFYNNDDDDIKKMEYHIFHVLKNIFMKQPFSKNLSVDDLQTLLSFINLIQRKADSKKNKSYNSLVSEFYVISQKVQRCMSFVNLFKFQKNTLLQKMKMNNSTANGQAKTTENMMASIQILLKGDKEDICTDQQYKLQCSGNFVHTDNSNDSLIIILFVIGCISALILLIIIFFLILCYRRSRGNINTEPITREDSN